MIFYMVGSWRGNYESWITQQLWSGYGFGNFATGDHMGNGYGYGSRFEDNFSFASSLSDGENLTPKEKNVIGKEITKDRRR